MPENTITVIGNLTRDPEVDYTTSGTAKARLGVAVNRRWNKDGEWQEETSFFNVTAWRELAENIRDTLTKGARVIISGRLEQRTWEADGEKRSVVEINADDIGPSLRWATATVVRTPKKEYGGGAPVLSDESISHPGEEVF